MVEQLQPTQSDQTGLGMLLGIVTLLFMIGLIVFVFTLTGNGLGQSTVYTVEGLDTIFQETEDSFFFGGASDNGNIYENYTIPAGGYTNVTWQTLYVDGNTPKYNNLTIPASCLTAYPNDLVLRYSATTWTPDYSGRADYNYSCSTGTGWENLHFFHRANQVCSQSGATGSISVVHNGVYEEGDTAGQEVVLWRDTFWNYNPSDVGGCSGLGEEAIIWHGTPDTQQGTLVTDVADDVVNSIAGTTTWFPIMVVIASMVVLILLTIIIITAVKSSGLLPEESA